MSTSYSIYRFAQPLVLPEKVIDYENCIEKWDLMKRRYLKEIGESVLLTHIDFIPHIPCGI